MKKIITLNSPSSAFHNPSGPAPDEHKQYIFVPYSYTVSSSAVNHGASNIQPLLLDQDADFELHEFRTSSSADSKTDFMPNFFSVQITDKNNSRIWSSGQLQQVTMNKLQLRRPVLLAKRSNLNINFVNVSTATDNVVCTIELHGFKVYVG